MVQLQFLYEPARIYIFSMTKGHQEQRHYLQMAAKRPYAARAPRRSAGH